MILLHCALKIGSNELKPVYNFILNSTRISFTKMGNMYETYVEIKILAKEYVPLSFRRSIHTELASKVIKSRYSQTW